jgi:glutamyl-tRNA reductase
MSTATKTELNDLNEKATELLKEKKDQENIINLSLKDIYYNLIHTIYDILNEVLDIGNNRDINTYLNIFFKKDRMIYIGIICIIVAIIINL